MASQPAIPETQADRDAAAAIIESVIVALGLTLVFAAGVLFGSRTIADTDCPEPDPVVVEEPHRLRRGGR